MEPLLQAERLKSTILNQSHEGTTWKAPTKCGIGLESIPRSNLQVGAVHLCFTVVWCILDFAARLLLSTTALLDDQRLSIRTKLQHSAKTPPLIPSKAEITSHRMIEKRQVVYLTYRRWREPNAAIAKPTHNKNPVGSGTAINDGLSYRRWKSVKP